jgi:hypothetical protein
MPADAERRPSSYVTSSKKTDSIDCFYSPTTGKLDKVGSDLSCTFDPVRTNTA